MKKFFMFITLIVLQLSCAVSARVIPYISARSQSENSAREIVLWQTQINLFEEEEFNGSFSITAEYTRTFKPNILAKALFGDVLERECNDSRCPRFAIQGSAVADRDPHAWLAEYFGLPIDYSSVIGLRPRISNFLVDFNLFLGLDHWAEGLFFRVHAPVVRTEWDLGFCEKDIDAGEMNHPLGYFNGSVANPNDSAALHYGVPRSNLLRTFSQYATRCQNPIIDGIIFEPLEKARFARCALKETTVAEIQMAFGWNFLRDEDYHVGASIRAAIPTGTRPQGRWLFEPIVGNGKHWEIGVGFTSHWTAWRSFDECDEFGIYFDANIMHMIKTRQCRTFDLCGKPLSRYMLASKMTTPVKNLKDANNATPSYQFDNAFSPVANLSTIPVDVSIAIYGDLVLKFAYIHKNFQFDVGYNFWGRTCEKITPHADCCLSEDTIWALKGDSFVYGFANDGNETPVPLSASEDKATIACGTNNINRTDALFWYTNPGVDNAKCAFDGGTNNIQNLVGGVQHNMFSSFDPIVFTTLDTQQWDIRGAQTSGMSHKIFMNFGYLWPEWCECITPYLGIGAEVEFGQTDNDCCSPDSLACITGVPAITNCSVEPNRQLPEEELAIMRNKSCSTCCNNGCSANNANSCCDRRCDCMQCTPSQWGVWLKGGISFNS